MPPSRLHLQAGHIAKKIYNFMLEKDEVTDVSEKAYTTTKYRRRSNETGKVDPCERIQEAKASREEEGA